MSYITYAHKIDCCYGCKYLKCTYRSDYSEEFDEHICTKKYTPKNLYGFYECEHSNTI